MADIKILASPDFEEQTAELVSLPDSVMLGIRRKGEGGGETIDLKENLETVTIQTEDEVRSLLGATGWGLVGSLMLGPTGLVLGALWGARKQKEICFAAHLKDGRKFLGVADVPTFQKLKAVTFRSGVPPVREAVADLGLESASPVMSVAAFAPVRFIVVAGGADEGQILALAQEVAADNPAGRRVVRRGDGDFPSAVQIAQFTAGIPDPGAVVLRPEGTVFKVLTSQQAKNAAAVARAFAFATGEGEP